MRRRDFLAIAGGAVVVWPTPADAQKTAVPTIGFLSVASSEAFADRAHAFNQGLAEVGFVDGRNVLVEYRWADFHASRLNALAGDLVRRKVGVIATFGGTSPALAAKSATKSIPIVFGAVSEDPVRAGLVASLSRPGGNTTGVVSLGAEIGPKRLELLRELIPKATVFAVLVNSSSVANAKAIAGSYQALAQTFGIQVHVLNVTNESELNDAFAKMAAVKAGGLVVAPDPFFNSVRSEIAALAGPSWFANDLSVSRIRIGWWANWLWS